MTGNTCNQPHITLAAEFGWSAVLSQKKVLVLIFSQSPFYIKFACSPGGCVGFRQGLGVFSHISNTCKWFCDSKLPSRIVNILTMSN